MKSYNSNLKIFIKEVINSIKPSQYFSDDLLGIDDETLSKTKTRRQKSLESMMEYIIRNLGPSQGMSDVNRDLNYKTLIVDENHPDYDPQIHFSRQIFENSKGQFFNGDRSKSFIRVVINAAYDFVYPVNKIRDLTNQNSFNYLKANKDLNYTFTFEEFFDYVVNFFIERKTF